MFSCTMPVPDPGPPPPPPQNAVNALKNYMILRVYTVMVWVWWKLGVVWGVLGGLGFFNGPHDAYANSQVKIKFANEFGSRYR